MNNFVCEKIFPKIIMNKTQRTFTLEVGGFDFGDRVVSEPFRVEAARITRDQVLCFEPRRQPLQMTVTVERVRQQVSAPTDDFNENHWTKLGVNPLTSTVAILVQTGLSRHM